MCRSWYRGCVGEFTAAADGEVADVCTDAVVGFKERPVFGVCPKGGAAAHGAGENPGRRVACVAFEGECGDAGAAAV